MFGIFNNVFGLCIWISLFYIYHKRIKIILLGTSLGILVTSLYILNVYVNPFLVIIIIGNKLTTVVEEFLKFTPLYIYICFVI